MKQFAQLSVWVNPNDMDAIEATVITEDVKKLGYELTIIPDETVKEKSVSIKLLDANGQKMPFWKAIDVLDAARIISDNDYSDPRTMKELTEFLDDMEYAGELSEHEDPWGNRHVDRLEEMD